ncbi:MAG: phosphoribosylglycinamide synthetase C domain-containing protein, partial [Chloroflexota bacterium]|nr:phosphoribosylglycinamide synthetase C domain-containing protein [Chloroflexota bacterium]
EIAGLSDSNEEFNSIVFHAGTKLNHLSKIYTDGGRVLICVGLGKDYKESKELAYKKIRSVKFDGMYYRKDIGENRDL